MLNFFFFFFFFVFFPPLVDGGSSHSGPAVTVTSLSPITSPYTSLLQQTEDQNPYSETPFISLGSPPLSDDYLMSLGEGEGISDLFDDLDRLPNLDDLLCNWRGTLETWLDWPGQVTTHGRVWTCRCPWFKSVGRCIFFIFLCILNEVMLGEWSALFQPGSCWTVIKEPPVLLD